MRRPSRLRARAAAFAAVAALPVALWAVLPTSPSAAPDAGALQGQIDSARSREHSLAADAAGFGALADQLAGDIAVLERRQAEVQASFGVIWCVQRILPVSRSIAINASLVFVAGLL